MDIGTQDQGQQLSGLITAKALSGLSPDNWSNPYRKGPHGGKAMQAIILWKNTQNGHVGFISDDDEKLAVFDGVNEAKELARTHPLLQAFPYQIVEVEM